MKHLRSIAPLAILAAASFLTKATHAQFDRTIGSVTDGSGPQHSCVIDTTGGRFMIHEQAQGLLIEKFSEQGEWEWTRALEGSEMDLNIASAAFAPDEGGGLYGIVLTNVAFEDGEFIDTTIYTLGYLHLDGSGGILNTSTHTLDLPETGPSSSYIRQISILPRGAGSLSVLISLESAPNQLEIHTMNMTEQGLATQHRKYGPVVPGEFSVNVRLLESPDGGLFLGTGTDQPLASLFIARINEDGEVAWANKYDYTNTMFYCRFSDIAVDDMGNIHASGSISLPTGNFELVPVIDENGGLRRCDMYRVPLFGWLNRIKLTTEGRFIFGSGYSPTLPSSEGNTILVADTVPTQANWYRRTTWDSPPNTVFTNWHDMDLVGPHMLLAGTIIQQHSVLAFQTHQRAILDMDLGEMNPCFFSDTLIERVEVPLNILETQMVNDFHATDTEEHWTYSSGSDITLNTLGAAPSSTLCISNGLESHSAPFLVPKFIVSSNSIRSTSGTLSALEVLDGQGRLFRSYLNVHDGTTITTGGWPSGLYLLRSWSEGGGRTSTQRIVLE
ncbi:MAG: hypothetical protein JNL43_04965 [Flavobacteriales bacterium]|nr:hypothetical protein [Flavobacteriales bacterium]